MSIIGDRVKARREELGLSQEALGTAVGVTQQNIVHIENGRTKRSRLVLELAEALKCNPKWLLGDEAAPSPTKHIRGKSRRTLTVRSNKEEVDNPAIVLAIDELDVRAQAGGGAMVDTENKIAEWRIPKHVVRGQTQAPSDALKIITVIGDSMEPTLMPGQRVMVDTEDLTPSPPGLFIVWDGLGLVAKRLYVLPHSDPVEVELVSDNKSYPPYHRTLDEAHIRGRVVGFWRWT